MACSLKLVKANPAHKGFLTPDTNLLSFFCAALQTKSEMEFYLYIKTSVSEIEDVIDNFSFYFFPKDFYHFRKKEWEMIQDQFTL